MKDVQCVLCRTKAQASASSFCLPKTTKASTNALNSD